MFKPIPIESFDEIQAQLREYAYNYITNWSTGSTIVESDSIFDVSPKLKNFFDKNSLEWDIARFFVTEPKSSIGIHIDGTEMFPKYLAMNLPIANCEDTYMKWWDNLDTVVSQDFAQYSPNIKVFEGANKIEIDSLELLSPHLVRIDIPHNIINCPNETRIILSLRFKPEPLHLWN